MSIYGNCNHPAKDNIMFLSNILIPDRYPGNNDVYPLGIIAIMNNIHKINRNNYNPYIYDINEYVGVLTIEEIAKKICGYKPQILGISANCTNMPYNAILTKSIKILARVS